MRIPVYQYQNNLRIYDLADVHRGDECCDVPRFLKAIETIRTDKNGFWVCTGDLLNVALKDSRSNVYKGLNIKTEYERLKKEIEPIANKCLGMVESNHHRRFERVSGLSLDSIICRDLKIPFLGKIGVICVTCGRASYYIAMHHGIGGGHKRGGKASNLEGFGDLIPGADIYLEGHTHSFDHFINEVPYVDRKRVSLQRYKAHFVVTGHFVEWEDSYAMNFKLKPRPIGMAMMELHCLGSGNADRKKVTVDFIQ